MRFPPSLGESTRAEKVPQIYQDVNDLWQDSGRKKSTSVARIHLYWVGVFHNHLIKHIAFLYKFPMAAASSR